MELKFKKKKKDSIPTYIKLRTSHHFVFKLAIHRSPLKRKRQGGGGAFPGGSVGEESARNAGDPVSVLGWGRFPGEGNGNPLQYSCLENPMEEPGGLQSMGSQRIGHDLATKLPPLKKKTIHKTPTELSAG